MDDFIFGTLASDELRRARALSLRSGVVHQFKRYPRDPKPGQTVVVRLTSGPTHPGERAWIYWTTDGTDPVGRGGKASHGFSQPLDINDTVWDVELWGYITEFETVVPGYLAGTVVRYRLSLEVFGEGEVLADGGAFYAYYVDDDPLPEWTRDAQIYHIFIDRFNPGFGYCWKTPDHLQGFYGGRIKGVTEKIDYIQNLGFNTLWLSPIFPSPSHHGYDATDLFEIEPRLGTKNDLNSLLDEAHRRGMRVLLDFVPNHWSNLHPTFQEAIRDPDSHYRDWYIFRHWNDDYEAFFGVKELPQINLRNLEARRHVLDAARYWLEFGVDGYRLDYAIGPTADFWADFRKVTRTAKPDCWTFGEIVDPADVQLSFEGQIDGSLDFLMLEAVRQSFCFGHWTGVQLAGFLEKHDAYFPGDFSRPCFIDNHDMNRYLWAAGGDKNRLRLAAFFQFTMSGPPVIYYGTEVGVSQERDVRQGEIGRPEEARLPMNWDEQNQDRNLLDHYQKLSYLRQTNPCLRRGKLEILQAGLHTLVYSRTLNDQRCVIAINLSETTQIVELPLSILSMLMASREGCTINVRRDGVNVELQSLAGAIFS